MAYGAKSITLTEEGLDGEELVMTLTYWVGEHQEDDYVSFSLGGDWDDRCTPDSLKRIAAALGEMDQWIHSAAGKKHISRTREKTRKAS